MGSSPATPRDPAPQAQPRQRAALPAPEGDFFSEHAISYYELGEEYTDDVADVITIEDAPNNALRVKLNTVGHTYAECFFEHTMTPSGPNEWGWSASETHPNCVVVLTQTETEILIDTNGECESEFCSYRTYLEAAFPRSSRRPVGTYEWPEM